MGIWEIMLIVVGLSMDAFAVSIPLKYVMFANTGFSPDTLSLQRTD